ncbi:hypothetical protein UFOVP386_41 [uncultured Caudovirales phage]|uniref:Uncharacterized protein n=1 Tax=uncultured Caudovirales phage TaxID=2100421 RepID=A0A6J7X4N2_9CAUD|nr:hypothetical protein UFOVP386_41 [uncultured Caudovirales phage]
MKQFKIQYHVSIWKNGEVQKGGIFPSIKEANERVFDLSLEMGLKRELDGHGWAMAYDEKENPFQEIFIIQETGNKYHSFCDMMDIYGEQKVNYVIGLVNDIGKESAMIILEDFHTDDEREILNQLF